MDALLQQLALAIERGKVNREAAYPPDLKEQNGASEITKQLLDLGVSANDILARSLMVGMKKIGDKFSKGQAFIPDLLISAKAMYAALAWLKPYFDSGEARHKGTIILGTVSGDLHDIGKNLVKMVMEGDGWKVVDLGANVSLEKFLSALNAHPGSMIGMSALLTTTMLNMGPITKQIKKRYPQTRVFVGGAPLSREFNDSIGADGYFPDPQSLTRHLNRE